MSKMKKLVLFLVEGITDKVALEGIVSNFFDPATTEIELTYGDIIYKDDVTAQNVAEKVGNIITEFRKTHHYHPEDIIKVVHLIDTDGAFIPPERVTKSSSKRIKYLSEHIECNSVRYVRDRNAKKCELVKKLLAKKRIADVPYQIFFLSRNLEHVFYNKVEDCGSEEKMELAETFSDAYCDNLNGFLELINDSDVAVGGTFSETWDFITSGSNSLGRHSNLHLIFTKKQ